VSERSGWTTFKAEWVLPWELEQQLQEMLWKARIQNGDTDVGMVEAIVFECNSTWDAEHEHNMSHRQQWERDAFVKARWRCERCGSPRNLHLHHRQHRARGGADTVANSEVLCAQCHERHHRPGST
jgi:hypothetical protein